MACLVRSPAPEPQLAASSGVPSTATASQPSSSTDEAARSGEEDTSSRETQASGQMQNSRAKVLQLWPLHARLHFTWLGAPQSAGLSLHILA